MEHVIFDRVFNAKEGNTKVNYRKEQLHLRFRMRKSDIFLKQRLANGLMKVLRNGTERHYLMLYGVVTAKVLRER